MDYKKLFYFDIETTSRYKSLFDFNLDDKRGHDLFLRKISTMKKFDNSWDQDPEQVYIEKSPLLPEFGKIICMSLGVHVDNEIKIITIQDDDEKNIINRIIKAFIRASETKKYPCGFNIKGFDLPFIIKKIYQHELELPTCLNFNDLKPWEVNIIDLSDIWKGLGRNTTTLDEVTYMLNIESPKITMTGDEIYSYYWDENNIKLIVEHCEKDVYATIKVAEKILKI